ncbi:hypothetical protein [Agriterribacter sp.]|uniref:hypothetical protein n=1 Tax=Agriterribacter sp. TaxID=2821509 RepID=UPI002C821740|nr:hypothetical protein [Agriterribacter sp.]HRO47185.1 hypothetical protein [Agriterribacter sp.]HRQ18712.1 hypothetical protein [Agriterribacter sp.]
MEYENFQTPFSKAFLTGLFVGIISTFICLTYNLVYRTETGFMPTDIINVASIIFGVNILFIVIGLIYFALTKASAKGELVFIILFSLLTVFLAWQAEGVNRSVNHEMTVQFRGLLLGVIIIMGIGASFLVPFLFHNKKFERNVL